MRFRGRLLKYPAQNIIINMTPPQAYDSFIKNKAVVTTIPMIDIQRTEFLFILYFPNNLPIPPAETTPKAQEPPASARLKSSFLSSEEIPSATIPPKQPPAKYAAATNPTGGAVKPPTTPVNNPVTPIPTIPAALFMAFLFFSVKEILRLIHKG